MKRLSRFWRAIREIFGDADYDRYLEGRSHCPHETKTLTRAEFYVASLEERYSRVSRCC